MSARSRSKRQERRRELRTIFKASTRLRNDFRGKKFTVHQVCHPEESDMPKSVLRGFTVHKRGLTQRTILLVESVSVLDVEGVFYSLTRSKGQVELPKER